MKNKALLLIFLIFFFPGIASALEKYKCAMNGSGIGKDLFLYLTAEEKVAVVWDAFIMHHNSKPTAVRYRPLDNGANRIRWRAGPLSYSANFRADSGAISVNIVYGTVSDSPVRLGARGTCKAITG